VHIFKFIVGPADFSHSTCVFVCFNAADSQLISPQFSRCDWFPYPHDWIWCCSFCVLSNSSACAQQQQQQCHSTCGEIDDDNVDGGSSSGSDAKKRRFHSTVRRPPVSFARSKKKTVEKRYYKDILSYILYMKQNNITQRCW